MSMWLITLESLVKDVWINQNYNEQGRRSLVCHKEGIVYYAQRRYRSSFLDKLEGWVYSKSFFSISSLSFCHKKLSAMEVI